MNEGRACVSGILNLKLGGYGNAGEATPDSRN
jgi:hypothetical protein